jgi:hypothetical protein
LLFYNDARHYHIYCYEPPISLDDARAPVDEIAGTGVDTFVYGFGVGTTMFHQTEVGEVWGTRLDSFGDVPPHYAGGTLVFWRAYENLMSLKERGVDLLTLLVERAHEKGLQFYGSLRLTHPADPKDVDAPDNWQFRIDHPEWCLRGRGKYNFNWVHPEVRAERFALVEEAVNKYDLDGLEIDCVLSPFYFEEGEVERNRSIMTEFMREVRRTVERTSQARGRPIVLGARVLPTRSANLAAGLDVPTWLSDGLLDFVVPNFYGDYQIDADFPFEWLVELARGTDCQVFPALHSRVGLARESRKGAFGEEQAGAEHYRAGAAAYWSKGANGIYLPWFNWPIGPGEREILDEIGDPDFLVDRPKLYTVRSHHEEAASYGYTAQLPLTLTLGAKPPGQTVELFAADAPERAEATLRLRLLYATSHDSLTVSLNGLALPGDTMRRTSHGYSPSEGPNAYVLGVPYYWLEYPLAPGALSSGRNEVAVALHARPANLTGQVVLDGLELLITR